MSGRGHLCEHGRLERSKKTGQCLICQRATSSRYFKNNKQKVATNARKYRQSVRGRQWANDNRARRAEYMRQWRDDNSDNVKEYEKHYERDVEKKAAHGYKYRAEHDERLKGYFAQYRKDNPGKCRAWSKAKKLRKIQRTPAWANQRAIAEIYIRCAEIEKVTGIPHHVDHIYPLNGRPGSGLHVENNLQILTAAENMAKSNRWPE